MTLQPTHSSILTRLQAWYSWHCDGDWEHQHGIRMSTVDNPGWRVSIDLEDTDQTEATFSRTRIERSKEDWLHCWRSGDVFEIACGAANLDEALAGFLEWVEANPAPKTAINFAPGQTVQVVSTPRGSSAGDIAVVREVRRIASLADAKSYQAQKGDPIYLLEYADGTTREIPERRLERPSP